MLKVAIVGNIASGKSTIENFLRKKGYKVYDTDVIAHDILASSPEVMDEFGTNIRSEIAKNVFSHPEKLKKLEMIIHPQVKEEILKIFQDNNEDIVFVSVPQLFEAGFDTLFDKIIYITADEKIRKERLIKRNNFTPEEAQRRIVAQNEECKFEKSDFVIENNSSLEVLYNNLNKVLDQLY